jgi:hypothetical protein
MTPKPNGTRPSGLFDTIKFPNKNKGGSLNPEYLASKGGGEIGGMGSGPKRGGALQDYLKNQKQASYTDRGVDFNYDRKTKTYSGGSREGSYSVPREVMKQLSTGTQGVSLKDYYTPKFSTVKETTMRMTNPNMPRQPVVKDPRPRNPGGLGSGMGTPIPRKPGMSNPRIPSTMVDPGRPRPMPVTPGKPSPMGNIATLAGKGLNAMGMKKGGMATKKKAGKISEYGGKEMYSSKKAMMKHEGMEGMKMEKSEGMKMRGGGMAAKGKGLAMKKGGMAPKGRGMAIMIAIGKPKGRGK